MKVIAATQRVELVEKYAERRDALDQRWSKLLLACGFALLPLPNNVAAARALVESTQLAGILLTGGQDPVAYGGNAPERDETETWLIRHALAADLPLLGVCRGMQMIQQFFGVPLQPVSGHVTASQEIVVDGRRDNVNSYHCLGAVRSVPELQVWATSDDGVVKAVRHASKRVLGFMWHPERFSTPRERDIALIRQFYDAGAGSR